MTSCRVRCRRMSCGISELRRMRNVKKNIRDHDIISFLPLPSCEKLIERSLIWSLLGRMSRHGLLPIPIDDISTMRISIFFFDVNKTKKSIGRRENICATMRRNYLGSFSLASTKASRFLRSKYAWCLRSCSAVSTCRRAFVCGTKSRISSENRQRTQWDRCRMFWCCSCRYKCPSSWWRKSWVIKKLHFSFA